MTEETKQNIDDMHYESMLALWRHASTGHPYFQGEIGEKVLCCDRCNTKRGVAIDKAFNKKK